MSDLREKAIEAFCAADSRTRYLDRTTCEAIEAVVAVCMEEAAACADQWTKPSVIRLAAGEMTAQELRTAVAVARGLAAALRALRGDEGGVDVRPAKDADEA